jgi:hypothetical protein
MPTSALSVQTQSVTSITADQRQQRDRIPTRGDQRRAGELLQRQRVAAHPLDQRAGRIVLEETLVEAHHVVDQPPLRRVRHLQADRHHDDPLGEARERRA